MFTLFPRPLAPTSRRRFTAALAASIALVALGSGISAPAPAEPPAAPADVKADPLARLAFLAGQWSSDSPKGYVEEHWSAPRGPSIMGMFRWCKPAPDSSPTMFELLAITAEGDDVLLRLRHFSPALSAKEEKDAPMTLKLQPSAAGEPANKAVFLAHANAGKLTAITYERTPKDRLLIEVAFTAESKREPLKFDLALAPRPW
jgi:hypothetical protein